jgi:hypothetical protein
MNDASSSKIRLLQRLFIALTLAGAFVAAGCGGGSSTSTPQISITLSPSATQTLDQGKTLLVTATVANDTSSQGVTWSLTGAGTLTGSATTGTTYNAPSSVTTASTATLTATSKADATKTATLTINLVPPPSISTTSLPAGTVGTAYSATLAVTGGVQPYTWSVTTGALPDGLKLDGSTGAITGTPTIIDTNPPSFTVQVTDSANLAAPPASLSITVNPAPLSVTTSLLPGGNVSASYSTTLAATGGVGPYTWSLTVGTLPDGLQLDGSTGAITGTPTVVNKFNFTVQVTDSLSATATKALSITVNPPSSVCPSGSESKLNGQYAFQMQGFDASGPVAISGSFDADGLGHIASKFGVEDVNRSSGVQTNVAIDSANSSYSVGSDNRGCLTLTIATSAVPSVFRISLGKFTSNVAAQGHLIEFDSTGTLGSGVIEKQDSNAFSKAQINGNYAFGVSSTLSLTTRSRFGAAGSFFASAGVITAGAVDTNDSGNVDNSGTNTVPASPLSFTGTYSDLPNGRGTLILNIGSTSINASIYVVSATKLLIMSIDPQTTNSLFAGVVLQQSGTPFSNASLSTSTKSVLYATGTTGATPPTSDVLVGILSIPSSGSFSRNGDENNGGTMISVAASGTYSVDSTTGRVTTITTSGVNRPVIWYLVSANKGFVLGVENSVSTGFFEPQSGGPFTNASASGSYSFGSIGPTVPHVSNESGVASFDGVDTVTGTNDSNSLGSGLSGNHFFSDTYSVTTSGRGTTAGGVIFYIISPTKAVLIDSQSTNPSLQEAEQ